MQSALLFGLTSSIACAGSGDDAATTESATQTTTASATTAAMTAATTPDTSATGAHGSECADIATEPGTRVVAHRDGGGVRLEASRMAITCSSNADSLCYSDTCYGYGINTLNFPASLGVGSHDLKMLADMEVGDLFCSSCDYVEPCAIQGNPDAPGTLVIEELTEDRIRGCVRASSPCFNVAFDVEYC